MTSFADQWIQAMQAELEWAPIRYPSWNAYEHARPVTTPHDTIMTVAAWTRPDHTTIHHRPAIGDIITTHLTPIDTTPIVTVHGAATPDLIDQMRQAATYDDPRLALAVIGEHVHTHSRLPVEHIHHTDPRHAGPVEYLERPDNLPGPTPVGDVYRIVAPSGLRLGPPIGRTHHGDAVFEPIGYPNGQRFENRIRITIHPGHNPSDYSAVIYRPDGHHWTRTALLDQPAELQRLATAPALTHTLAPHLEHGPVVTPMHGVRS